MKELNLPWVESPFFAEELNRRGLSAGDAQDAQKYNENGFLVLSDVFSKEEIEATSQDLKQKLDGHFSRKDPRAMNLWQHSSAIKALCTHPKIMAKLEMLYGREPIPFQTLNFKYGSQQNPHSDTIHFNSLPARYMCGVWVALEDTDEDNGTLIYYPGSHKLPIFDYSFLSSQLDLSPYMKDEKFYVERYEPFIKELMAVKGLQAQTIKAKKGDVLIWSANLIHGGLPVKDPKRTRWSQVNHYYFKDCLYFTPQLSNSPTGEWFLRKITNINTGESTWGSYNGQPVKRKVAPGFRYLISRYAPYNWRDGMFIFTRLYHRFFRR